MTDEDRVRLAAEEGFSAAAVIDTGSIVFDPAFRPYCEENLCGQYGVNYACPPDCGTPEEMRSRALRHKRALVLQTMWEISDYGDQPAIKQAKRAHNAAELRLVQRLRQCGDDGLIVGASGCALCPECAIRQHQPCRYPQLQYSCMSAYCVFVRETVEKCGMEYDCGPGLLAFFGMFLFD